jgi:ABC-2 type transport system ATP-binding protein
MSAATVDVDEVPSADVGQPMIKVRDLRKFYGSFEALKGISFTVGNGEIVGFLGPNGAGKTTTMKILTGYISATSGWFGVAGFDGFDQSLDVRRNIGYLPENAPLYPDMGIVEYLGFVCQIRRIPSAKRKARIEQMVETVGLTSMIKKNIGELSKGYRQRVGLAQALIHEPPVLILDEPTSGLDPNQIVEIRKLIRDLGRERTIILSTHNLPEVQMTCSRMIIIANGVKVADGTAEEIQRQHADSQHWLVSYRPGAESVESITAALSGVPNVQAVQALETDSTRVNLRVEGSGGDALAEGIYGASKDHSLSLVELRRDVMDLEKIFHQLTQY